MSQSYASGKHALAICDRCGCRTAYRELKVQVVNRRPSGLRVCSDCLDLDHPQLQLNTLRIDDPQALRNPRPEIDRDTQRELIP